MSAETVWLNFLVRIFYRPVHFLNKVDLYNDGAFCGTKDAFFVEQ